MSDRSWAVGLSQADFEREFQMRNPGADVIPDVNEWSNSKELEYFGISGIIEHELEEVSEEKPEENKKNKLIGKFPCRGCGKVFDYAVARAGHERKCQVVINGGSKNV